MAHRRRHFLGQSSWEPLCATTPVPSSPPLVASREAPFRRSSFATAQCLHDVEHVSGACHGPAALGHVRMCAACHGRAHGRAHSRVSMRAWIQWHGQHGIGSLQHLDRKATCSTVSPGSHIPKSEFFVAHGANCKTASSETLRTSLIIGHLNICKGYLLVDIYPISKLNANLRRR